MKNIKYLLAIMLFATCFTACEKAILGSDSSSDAVNVFETVWNDLDQHYGLFTIKELDWDAVYETYRPQVNEQTTDEELWTVLGQMIRTLNDGHTFILDFENQKMSNAAIDEGSKPEENFSLDLVEEKYLASELQSVYDDGRALVAYNQIKDKDIGYLYMGNMANDANFDKLFDALKDHEAIVIDIRRNPGGFDEYSIEWSSYFADGEHFVYTAQTRNGPNHDDFDEKTRFYTELRDGERYQKPVILLTDKFSVSAAEAFTLHMTAFAHVTQIGNYTAGFFSDRSRDRFLPNGWIYAYSTQIYLLPDGTCPENIGCQPDVLIKNTEEDIAAGNDLILERALTYLKEEYGIE